MKTKDGRRKCVSCQILNSLPSRERACAPRVRIRLSASPRPRVQREQGHSLATIHPSCHGPANRKTRPALSCRIVIVSCIARSRKGPLLSRRIGNRYVYGRDVCMHMSDKSRRGFERRAAVSAHSRAGQLKVAARYDSLAPWRQPRLTTTGHVEPARSSTGIGNPSARAFCPVSFQDFISFIYAASYIINHCYRCHALSRAAFRSNNFHRVSKVRELKYREKGRERERRILY